MQIMKKTFNSCPMVDGELVYQFRKFYFYNFFMTNAIFGHVKERGVENYP